MLLCPKINYAQQYNFKSYTVKNGLGANTVNNVFQDSRGYIWYGTQDGGLGRFDYKTFKNYTNKDGLVGNNIIFITEDSKKNIWIGTSEGVSMFDGVRFRNYTSKDGLKDGFVYCIYESKNNVIWFGQGGGLDKLENNKFTSYNRKNSLPSDTVYTVTEDKKGNIWLGLNKGIAKYDGKNFMSYGIEKKDSEKAFFSSCKDSKGNLWFGTKDGNIIKWNGNKLNEYTLPKDAEHAWITSINEDNNGNMWFATYKGVVRYNGINFSLFTQNQGLIDNTVNGVCKDYEGKICLATNNGAAIFQNEELVNYGDKEGLGTLVNSMVETGVDAYLVTQNEEIKLFANDVCSPLTTIRKFDEGINYLKIDSKNNLWVGTISGIYKFRKEKEKYVLEKSIKDFNKTTIGQVVKIIEDEHGAIWVATYGTGILKFENDTIIYFNKTNELGTSEVLSMFEDSNGGFWFGTFDKGLIKLKDGKYFRYSEKKGELPNKQVNEIAEDELHNMYFATNDGLCCYDGKKFVSLYKENGLCSNLIHNIFWDNSKNCLWVGTNFGINKIKFGENFSIKSIKYYGEDEGLKDLEVSGIYKDSKNQLFFYTSSGLVKYKRDEDYEQAALPKIKLTDILLDYKTIAWTAYSTKVDKWSKLPQTALLPYNKNQLLFRFHALSSYENWMYQFMIVGLDKDWSPPTKNPEAFYPTIPPGQNYIFRVRLISADGKKKDENLFKFTISPPWWQTWWFYGITGILLVIGIYVFIRVRTSQLEKENLLLEDKVNKRTNELKESNTKLADTHGKLSAAFNDIKDSITYAKKIQDAILPLDTEIKKALPESFVLFKPRDVVSGDFYWFYKKDDKIFIAAVDCTGHGVPGAFMSMIGNSLLNEIVGKEEIPDAATVLKKLHNGTRKSLKQDRDSYESKDGMDLALAIIDRTTNTLQYSGAKRPLFYYNGGKFEETKGDKQSIGGLEMEDVFNFTNYNFELKQGDTFYLFTDGIVDQFGGIKDSKFSTKRLKATLQELQSFNLYEQGKKLGSIIEEWKLNTEQTDDILVIGFRV